ncbi:MAG: 2,4-dienoyl-CoA reductase [Acidobacteria bacterium]|nr:MAG: 2,4-dienoyl-CoA reductase [Acidobacteriota bacterium]
MPEQYQPDLLKGRHVAVTGGGTGLGREMALRFASLGASVTVCGRRPGPLEQTVADIRAAGGRAEAVACNVREMESVEAFVKEAEERQGDINALVNNAAGNFLAPTTGLTPNGFDVIVRTNLYGSFYATQACGRRWIERGTKGAVLSIATTYAEPGSAFLVPSAVSKAGVVALTKSLAAEWGVYGIRLNAIAPGPFPTEGAWSRLSPDGRAAEKMINLIPLRRAGELRELTDLAVFLLSDLSSYLTGEVIYLDGGASLTSAGQFNLFTEPPREQVLEMFERLRPAKGSK